MKRTVLLKYLDFKSKNFCYIYENNFDRSNNLAGRLITKSLNILAIWTSYIIIFMVQQNYFQCYIFRYFSKTAYQSISILDTRRYYYTQDGLEIRIDYEYRLKVP